MAGAGLFIPLSELKALRRAAANRCLETLRRRPSSQGLSSTPVLPGMLKHITSTSEPSTLTSAAVGLNALNGALSHSAASLTPRIDSSILHTGSSSSAEAGRLSETTEAMEGAEHRTVYNAANEQADSSSGSSRSGRPQQQQQQPQLRLLCRTMAQV